MLLKYTLAFRYLCYEPFEEVDVFTRTMYTMSLVFLSPSIDGKYKWVPSEMCAHTAHKAGAVRGCAQSKGSTLQERIVHTAHKEGVERSGIGLLTVGVQTRRSSLSKPGPDFSNLHSNGQKS